MGSNQSSAIDPADLKRAQEMVARNRQQRSTSALQQEQATSALQQPSISAIRQPSTSALQQPSTSAIRQPSTSAIRQQTTSTLQRKRATSALQQPPTPAIRQQAMSTIQQKTTSALQQPSISALQQPSISALQQPSTSALQRQQVSPALRQQKTSSAFQRERTTSAFRQQKATSALRQQQASATNQGRQNATSRQSGFRGKHNQNREHANRKNQNDSKNDRLMGFKSLEILSQKDVTEIIHEIYEKKASFSKLLDEIKPTEEYYHNFFVLIVEVMAKVSLSSFVQLKLGIILQICNSQFIAHLVVYLMQLPSTTKKNRNKLYWDDQEKFWSNIATFCECVINVSPSTATLKLKYLIEDVTKFCIENLVTRHGLTLSEGLNMKMVSLRERLNTCEEEKVLKKQKHQDEDEDAEPPENFRELSVLPTSDDLMEDKPFVRANIVRGQYRDVEHYLDVQFRLLREDCYGPLRKGINQLIKDPKGKKFDNIKVYKNVQFVGPYVTKTKVGSLVKLDEQTNRRFKRINWAHSKRFIFGSLLLLTKDNCRSFIVATIVDREEKLLKQGMIPIATVDPMGDNLYNNDMYMMIESEVYFEPYLHVLNTLKDPSFPKHLAMSKYIINVDPQPNPPAYLSKDSTFKIELENETIEFHPQSEETWPTPEQLGLNASQYEAYKLALTHEFTVIQGPPGTGKTYLGVKIAKTLIENVKPSSGSCLMLIICYTNHALDQFLEAIMPLTKFIARVGGQSRSEAMQKININKLRMNTKTNSSCVYEQKIRLRDVLEKIKEFQQHIQYLENGVISFDKLVRFVPVARALSVYYETNRRLLWGDILMHWLFEHMELVDFRAVVEEERINEIQTENSPSSTVDVDYNDEQRMRLGIILDDDDSDEETHFILDKNSNSFSVEETRNEMNELIILYQKMELGNPNRIATYNLIVVLKSQLKLFNEMSTMRNRNINLEITDGMDMSIIPPADRWALYFRWAKYIVRKAKERVQPLMREFQEINTALEEARMAVDCQILQNYKVIGMTTSGAARLNKLLRNLKPPIVIIEEAAEVLEQHIVTSLTEHCKHLILIGDHKQLRPSASNMQLARHYNIEISLFERMITNGMHSRRLTVQHRMKPEFAELICPHIYPDLENHPSVTHFPAIRGMTDDLFFMTHNFKEEPVEDSSSRTNQMEGDLTLGLANYLMQQGYNAEDITILAAYSGQMFYLRTQRQLYKHLSNVKITVLDNYQGEECKIILLSLVRNNDNQKIGFLGTENRVCVALSRAREGMYIFGNIDILKANSEIWKKVGKTLEDNVSLGPQLLLRCEIHPDVITTISLPEDFSNKAPEGGCLSKCDAKLPCGHQCQLICHGYDRGHVKTICKMKCERGAAQCELGHPCPLECSMPCLPCKELIEKTLPCGHKMNIFCHLDPNDPKVKCLTNVTVTLPHCKHEATKPCYREIDQVRCPEPCVYRIECGHECVRRCHVTDDPDHEKYLCEKPCARAKKGCTAKNDELGDHQCSLRCHEKCDDCIVQVKKRRKHCTHTEKVACNFDVDGTPCKKKCARMLDCGHHCQKKCFEPCGDCKQKVTKVISECQHRVTVACMDEATRFKCEAKCERTMTCGHRCLDLCRRTCDQTKCRELLTIAFESPCGHKVRLPCNVYNYNFTAAESHVKEAILLQHCSAPCGKELECGHICVGSCGQCRQGRLHVPCGAPCHVTNICGHRCKEPCNQLCPPCAMPCEMKCSHSRCNKICGEPCVPCQEPCNRRCRHGGACHKRCGEPCSRAPCDEPCPRALPCGHPCRGLCGELCPDVCNICRPEQFPKDILNDDLEDDDKVLQLVDCSHVFEVNFLDHLVKTDCDDNEVKIPKCPLCRKPIINTSRYKDIIAKKFKEAIDPIKRKVCGNREEVEFERKRLVKRLEEFRIIPDSFLAGSSPFTNALQLLEKKMMSKKKISLLNLQMQNLYLDILDMIRKEYHKYDKLKTTELKQELLDVVKMLCSSLSANVQKISQQLQKDVHNEIKRMYAIIQLATLVSNSSYLASKGSPTVTKATDEAKSVILTWREYNEEKGIQVLKELQKSVKMAGVLSLEERKIIVKVMGLKQGHWFKCANGHIYCIGECGGAMEKSNCPDCGAVIGGENHRLAPSNHLAPEMDSAPFAAWSEEYNNMANFDL